MLFVLDRKSHWFAQQFHLNLPFEFCSGKVSERPHYKKTAVTKACKMSAEKRARQTGCFVDLANYRCAMLHTCHCTTTETVLQEAHATIDDVGRFTAQDSASLVLGICGNAV